ncbi:unnamed protein product [Lupinus luteus]|uniref:pectinesterase n=1 Tax=Lupinus luteus TaxID=3873 RepID=A0AAV1XJ63_LUPLU
MDNSDEHESQQQRRYRLRQYVRQRRNNMDIHRRQQELARRCLTRYERNNTNEAQPNQNNFDAHTNTGFIHNSFEEISTNISTPMRLTVVRQIARSSFQQQIQAGSTHGPVAETTTNISTSIRLTSIHHIARSFLRRQFRTSADRDSTIITYYDYQQTDISATFSSFTDNIIARCITFKNCILNATSSGYVTAHGRNAKLESSGFVLKGGKVIGNGKTMLGRAYGPFSRVIFYETYLSSVVALEGWSALKSKEGQCFFR